MKHENETVMAPRVIPAKSKEIFAEKYAELCKEQGFQIAFEPRWAQSKDTGDYRLIILASVIPYKEEDASI
jgi:hypothetical protein